MAISIILLTFSDEPAAVAVRVQFAELYFVLVTVQCDYVSMHTTLTRHDVDPAEAQVASLYHTIPYTQYQSMNNKQIKYFENIPSQV